VFSSGHDLRDLVGAGEEDVGALFAHSATLMERMHALPKPIIAQVQGLASAAGLQLAASCDLIVAAETATFQTPGVRIGLFCSTPMVPLSRAVPPKKALEMLFTGRPVSAQEAERMGLVNRVVPAERLAAATLELAEDIVQYSADTLGLGKRAFYRQLPLDEHAAYVVGREAMARNSQTEDAQEGMAAFLQKRPPRFRQ
jgi:enoyl-CoA hydratase/carnithine racemase